MNLSEESSIETCHVCGLTLCKMRLVHIKHAVKDKEGGWGGGGTDNREYFA